MLSFTGNSVHNKHVFVLLMGLLSINAVTSFHAVFMRRERIPWETLSIAGNQRYSQPYESLEICDLNTNIQAVTRRSALISSLLVFSAVAAQPQHANADVSDGNALPKGAQQFARTLKLKTDIKDVSKRLLSASDDNAIDKKEWDNIGKFLRTVYSTAENDMKEIAKGLSYNPSNQERAYRDVDEIKKYSQAGDVSVSKQDAARLASILAKISEFLEDFLSSLSDVPDEI